MLSLQTAQCWLLVFLGVMPGMALAQIAASDAAQIQPQSRPTSRDAPAKTMAQIKDEDQQQWNARLKALPKLPEKPMGEILKLSRSQDRLTFDSTLMRNETAGTYWIPVKGTPLQAMLGISRGALAGKNYCSFECYDYSDPDLIDRHLQVLAGALNLQIVQDIEFADRTQSVQLIQNPNEISLFIQIIPEGDQPAATKLRLTSPTLGTLRLEHSAEYEQYLRPIMQDLKQERAVFAVNENMAWQVLADTYKTSPELKPRVDALVEKLNAEDFAAREAAEKQLRDLGQAAALYLLKIDRSTLSPEQGARVDSIVHAYQLLTPEQVQILGADNNFLLDCLASGDDNLRASALDRLRRNLGHAIPFDLKEPATQRYAGIDQLRRRLAPTTREK